MYYLWMFSENSMRGRGHYLPAQQNWSGRIALDQLLTGDLNICYLSVTSENGRWLATPPEGFWWEDQSIDACELTDGSMLKLMDEDSSVTIVASMYTKASTVMKKFCWPQGTITIGKADDCNIVYDVSMVSRKHGELFTQGRQIFYQDHSTNGSWVNGRLVKQRSISLEPGDCIDIAPALHVIVFGQFFAISSVAHVCFGSGFVPYQLQSVAAESAPEDSPVTREYHRAPRQIQQPNCEPIAIDPPLEKERGRRTPAWLTIGPSMTMILPMLVSTLVMQRSMGASLLMIGTSSALSVMWSTINRRYEKQEGILNEENRQKICKQYYAEMEELLIAETERERKRLQMNHLSVNECVQLPFASGHRMWERLPNNEDFLSLRLGTGEERLPGEIGAGKLRISLADDPLRHEPQRLVDTYQMMKDVPIVLDAKQHRIIGVLGNKTSPWLLQSMVTQLAACHSYHDVRIVVIHGEEDRDQWHFAHRLPHVYATDDRTLRMVVCGEVAVQEVLSNVDNALSIRADAIAEENKDKKDPDAGASVDIGRQIPWYVVFVTDPKLMENQPLLRFINTPGLGFTMVMQAVQMESLPKECELIIEARSQLGTVFRSNGTMTGVNFEAVEYQQLQHFARGIAPFRIKEMLGDNAIPTLVTFLQTYGVRSVDELDICRIWAENHAWQNIKAVLGMKAGNVPFILDISYKNQGPHGLIAGTTGAGKSVLLQSFILSLAINYSPTEVQFILIDYKGGGTSEDFKELPHAAGVIDSLQGERTIFRALASIQGEIKRREAIFKDVGVNDIDDYMKLFNADPDEEPLGHLIIVVDEFAELKKEQPDFMRELVSAARVGRSLGMHLVLATQKPGNSVSDEIDANTRFRICLRVASRSDSTEMLKRPEAAYLKGMGRCYVQVGNDEVFEQVQTSWSGSPYKPDALRPEEEPRLLNEAGQPIKFRKKKQAAGADGKKEKEKSELDAVMEHIQRTCARYHIASAKKMWLDEMPESMLLEELPFFEGKQWDGQTWPMLAEQSIYALYGMADNIDTQKRIPAVIDFQQDRNIMIFGLSGSGKTTALQTIAVSLALRYTPAQVNIYVFSLTSQVLQSLKELPHVGEVVYEDEIDEQIRLMELIAAESERRKKLFRTLATDNFIQYNRSIAKNGDMKPVPAIVVLVDRMQQLRDWENYKHDDKLNLFYDLLRSAASQGIFFVMTAFARNELPNKYQSFITGLTLLQNDRTDYADALGTRVPMEWAGIREYPGRGVMAVDDKEAKVVHLYESQVAVYHSSESDKTRSDAIVKLGRTMRAMWQGAPVPGIVRIPKKPILELLLETPSAQQDMQNPAMLPLCYVKNNGTVHSMNLHAMYSGLIVGPKRSGKTNLIKNMAEVMLQKGMQVHVVGGDSLLEWAKKLGASTYAYGGEEWIKALGDMLAEIGKRSKALTEAQAISKEAKAAASECFIPIVVLIDDIDRFIDSYQTKPQVLEKLKNFVDDNPKIISYRFFTFATASHKGYMSNRFHNLMATMSKAGRGIMLRGMLSECDPFDISGSMSYQVKNMVYPIGEALLYDKEKDEMTRVVIPLNRPQGE